MMGQTAGDARRRRHTGAAPPWRYRVGDCWRIVARIEDEVLRIAHRREVYR